MERPTQSTERPSGRRRSRMVRVGIAALVVTASVAMVAPGAGAQAAGPETPVLSNGQKLEVGAVAATERFAPSNPGTGVATTPASSSTRPPNLTYPSNGSRPLYIFGADSRTRVNPTTTYPARATVHITWTSGGGTYSCSGWMLNANTVGTAGHCVAPGNGTWYTTSTYTITPGKNGSTNPYGSCKAKWLATTTGWKNSGDNRYDYAAIKLNCSVGNTTGWYGMFWQSASLTGSSAQTQGYPGDKTWGTQWYTSGTVSWSDSTRLRTLMDIYPGQSGSPFYRSSGYNGAACNPCVMGVVSWQYSSYNQAARISEAAFNNYNAWKVAP